MKMTQGDLTANDLYKDVESKDKNIYDGMTLYQMGRMITEHIHYTPILLSSRKWWQSEIEKEEYWYTRIGNLFQKEMGYQVLRTYLRHNMPVIAGVNVNRSNGKLGMPTVTYHWLGVTGMSSEWEKGDLYQWVRVIDPFDNSIEYYHAEHFHKHWHYYSDVTRRSLIALKP